MSVPNKSDRVQPPPPFRGIHCFCCALYIYPLPEIVRAFEMAMRHAAVSFPRFESHEQPEPFIPVDTDPVGDFDLMLARQAIKFDAGTDHFDFCSSRLGLNGLPSPFRSLISRMISTSSSSCS